ncbi:hypothetical protein EVAR_94169_1 [Eumeta japonica]|uniref:Uncharacterized protein n=1 Tax=Eumeta variegata TaxID=151549 RepID=A0A4C1UNZ5_EUMVA|nr:hypothetical protein EVAR_94169_1 [Eumeta japonica]
MRGATVKYILIAFLLVQRIDADEEDETYLMKYMESLDDIVQFADEHRTFVGINLGFGLFLAQVNLKAALEKSDFLPASVVVPAASLTSWIGL